MFLALAVLLSLSSFASAGPPPDPEQFVYKKAGKHSIRADVYRPEGKGPWPVVVWFHGGSLVMGGREWLPTLERSRLLAAGIAVVSVDYRLSPQAKLAETVDDALDAYAWVRAKGPKLFSADKNRVAVMGHSAGGYLALLVAQRAKARPRAVAVLSGFGALLTPFFMNPSENLLKKFPPVSSDTAEELAGTKVISNTQSKKRYLVYVRSRQQNTWLKDATGRDPVKEKDWFRAYEPVHNIDAKFPPVIQLHSQDDEVLPLSEATPVRDALRKAGVRHEFLLIPGDDHSFNLTGKDRPEVQLAMNRLFEFLASELKR